MAQDAPDVQGDRTMDNTHDAKMADDEQDENRAIRDHFVSDEVTTHEIEGVTFHLREMDGEELDAMKSAAHTFDGDGNFVEFDVSAKHNHLLKKAVVDAPAYDDIANERYGEDFSDLGMIDKLDLLNDLRGRIREKLLDACLQKQGLSDDEKN